MVQCRPQHQRSRWCPCLPLGERQSMVLEGLHLVSEVASVSPVAVVLHRSSLRSQSRTSEIGSSVSTMAKEEVEEQVEEQEEEVGEETGSNQS